MSAPWSSWALDWVTWGWVAWMVFFGVWETVALLRDPLVDPLTAHLRPLFVNHPLTWFLAFGAWLWLGVHFLVEPFLRRGA